MPTRRRPRPSPPRPLHQVYVPSHPLAAHWLAVARNKASPSPVFRSAIAELGRILVYEAVDGWLPTVSGEVDTPCGVADCTFVDPGQPVKVVPILRAGLVLLEQVGGEGLFVPLGAVVSVRAWRPNLVFPMGAGRPGRPARGRRGAAGAEPSVTRQARPRRAHSLRP